MTVARPNSQHFLLKFSASKKRICTVFAVTWFQCDVFAKYQFSMPGLVNLLYQSQGLAMADAENKAGGMCFSLGALAGYFPGANRVPYVGKETSIGIADRYGQMAILVAMSASEGDRSVGIDKPGQIGCIACGKRIHACYCEPGCGPDSKRKTRQRAGFLIGGGGGTAYPHLSIWAGLFLHLHIRAGEGVCGSIARQPIHPSTP